MDPAYPLNRAGEGHGALLGLAMQSRECATLTPNATAGHVSIGPSACVSVAASRCLVVPTHERHYHMLHRLIQNVQRFGLDDDTIDRVRTVAIFSAPANLALSAFCTHFPLSCTGRLEGTDLYRLVGRECSNACNHGSETSRSCIINGTRCHRSAAQLVGDLMRMDASTILARGCKEGKIPFSLPATFFLQSFKKILGVAMTRCDQAWVVDSESTPFQPFSFKHIFDHYWQDPIVYYKEVPVQPKGCTRGQILGQAGAKLLGIREEAGSMTMHSYRLSDYWQWSADTMRAAMRRAVVSTNSSSFIECFIQTPVHELFYYNYAYHSRSTHRFVDSASLLKGESLSGCSSGSIVDISAWMAQLNTADGWERDWKLDKVFAQACQKLASIDQPAVRYRRALTGNATEHRTCLVPLKRAGDWLRHMALHCARDGVLSKRPLSPAETAFQWWLSEANIFELDDFTKAPVWQLGNLSKVTGPSKR